MILAYLRTTWGNMVVIKAGGANTTSGRAEALDVAMGKGLGIIVALIPA